MSVDFKPPANWEDRSHLRHKKEAPHGLVGCYVGKKYSVQRFVKLTEVGFVDHLMVRRHDDKPLQSWSDMQKIKNQCCPEGRQRIGVQVFPKEEELIDQANMYHIWVYPKSFDLPFNLKGNKSFIINGK